MNKAAALVFALLGSSAFGAAPRTFNFQGALKTPANTYILNGTYTVTFTLYDGAGNTNAVTGEAHTVNGAGGFSLAHNGILSGSDAVTNAATHAAYTRGTDYTIDNTNGVIQRVSAARIPDGTQVLVNYTWNTKAVWQETQTSVTTKNGAFSTMLGAVTPLPAGSYFDEPLYMGVKVDGDAEMTPRVPLRAVPYAAGLTLPVSATGSADGAALAIVNANAGFNSTGVSATGAQTGLKGLSANGTGNGVEGYGQIGVLGSSTDGAYGVYGTATGGQGTGDGVAGFSDVGNGVYGANGPLGGSSDLIAGVVGYSPLTNGTGAGGQAFNGPTAKGVAGESKSGYGGYFTSVDNTGTGAYGEGKVGLKGYTTLGGGISLAGVIGESSAANGNGVIGIGHGSTAYGVWGSNPAGLAGYFDGGVTVTGDLKTNGTDYAAQSVEHLRVVRGVVGANGTPYYGSGFTASKTATGTYHITFSTAFSGIPTIVATPDVTSFGYTAGASPATGAADVYVGLGATPANQPFHFIAIGPK